MCCRPRYLAPRSSGGTLAINIVGSHHGASDGVVNADIRSWSALEIISPYRDHGGFTTFSTFSLDTLVLLEREATGAAFAYVLLSVFVSIAALFAGLWIVRQIT